MPDTFPKLCTALFALAMAAPACTHDDALDVAESGVQPGQIERDGDTLRAEFSSLSDGENPVPLSGRIEIADRGAELIGRMRLHRDDVGSGDSLEVAMEDFKAWRAGYSSIESTEVGRGSRTALPPALASCSTSARGMVEVRMSRAPEKALRGEASDDEEIARRLAARERAERLRLFDGRLGEGLSRAERGGYGTDEVAETTFAHLTVWIDCNGRRFSADVAGLVVAADEVAQAPPVGGTRFEPR